MLVAEAIGRTLAERGVDAFFGLVGSGNFAVTNALHAAGAAFYSSRHECGAVMMADGYARVSGKVGVCTVHQGPGFTNTLTGLTEAAKSRTPLVVLAADTPSGALWSNFKIDQAALAATAGAIAERVREAGDRRRGRREGAAARQDRAPSSGTQHPDRRRGDVLRRRPVRHPGAADAGAAAPIGTFDRRGRGPARRRGSAGHRGGTRRGPRRRARAARGPRRSGRGAADDQRGGARTLRREPVLRGHRRRLLLAAGRRAVGRGRPRARVRRLAEPLDRASRQPLPCRRPRGAGGSGRRGDRGPLPRRRRRGRRRGPERGGTGRRTRAAWLAWRRFPPPGARGRDRRAALARRALRGSGHRPSTSTRAP